MNGNSVRVQFRPDRTAIVQGTENPAIRVLFNIRPGVETAVAGPPATVVVLLDCSGTVRRFSLEPEQAERWIEVARERSELRAVESDLRLGYQITGRTLQEIRGEAVCPLSVVAQALQNVVGELREGDACCIVGFATNAGILYDGRRNSRSRSAKDVLEAIQRDTSAHGLGDRTRMAEAARIAAAMLKSEPDTGRVRRLIIITDGIVEDQAESLRELEQIRNQGISVSTVGVGQEFDEEFLGRIADWTGGLYYYAATPQAIESRLAEDFGAVRAVVANNVTVSARGREGACVMSVSQLTPQMRMFEEIRLNEDWIQVDVGDVAGATGLGLLEEIALPWLAVGKHAVGDVRIEWRNPQTGEAHRTDHTIHVECLPPGAPAPPVDADVEEMFMRLQVYRAERAAQWAHESGREAAATVRLREASDMLRRLGEIDLAQRFEQQAADMEARQPDSDRTKTLKDWVRRLARRDKDVRDRDVPE